MAMVRAMEAAAAAAAGGRQREKAREKRSVLTHFHYVIEAETRVMKPDKRWIPTTWNEKRKHNPILLILSLLQPPSRVPEKRIE